MIRRREFTAIIGGPRYGRSRRGQPMMVLQATTSDEIDRAFATLAAVPKPRRMRERAGAIRACAGTSFAHFGMPSEFDQREQNYGCSCPGGKASGRDSRSESGLCPPHGTVQAATIAPRCASRSSPYRPEKLSTGRLAIARFAPHAWPGMALGGAWLLIGTSPTWPSD
jgi:hypothetical protein